MDRFDNATVVIAGASSGIGLATAFAFARRGANLVLGARRGEALRRAAAACEELGAGRAVPFEVDVGEVVQVQRLADAAVESFGRIDVWFNNAGVGVVGPFELASLAEHVRVIETNLLGAVHGSHAAVRQFLAQGGPGTLINMSSQGGIFPAPFAASYTASKFGIAGFTDSLRAELGVRSEIEVCGVYPSFVDTPAIGYAGNHSGHDLTAARPNLDPEDVAERIVSLVRHPRRALFIGGPPAPRLAAALLPDIVLRGVAGMAARALASAPPAPPTSGNLLAPPSAPPSIRRNARAARSNGGAPSAVAVLGVAAAVGGLAALAVAARRSAAA